MSKITLELSHADLHGLHDAVDKARAGAVLVKVPRKALVAMLLDHGKLVRHHAPMIGGVL